MSFIFNYIKSFFVSPPEPEENIIQSVPPKTFPQNREIWSGTRTQDFQTKQYSPPETNKYIIQSVPTQTFPQNREIWSGNRIQDFQEKQYSPPETKEYIIQSVPPQTFQQNRGISSGYRSQNIETNQYGSNSRDIQRKPECTRKKEICVNNNEKTQFLYDKAFPPLPKMDPYDANTNQKKHSFEPTNNIYSSYQMNLRNFNKNTQKFHDEEDQNAKNYELDEGFCEENPEESNEEDENENSDDEGDQNAQNYDQDEEDSYEENPDEGNEEDENENSNDEGDQNAQNYDQDEDSYEENPDERNEDDENENSDDEGDQNAKCNYQDEENPYESNEEDENENSDDEDNELDEEYDENDNYYREYKNISQFSSLNKYFDFFKNKYNFDFDSMELRNPKELFEQLSRSMRWSRKHNYELGKLQRIRDHEEKESHVKMLCEENEYDYDFEIDSYGNFENLSGYLGWNIYNNRRDDFNELVGSVAERKFSTVELMIDLIKKYGIDKQIGKIPKTMDECKEILEKYLFVNIYDFAGGSTQRFNSLVDLRKYTAENNLFYPLEQAKDNYVYRILLRHLK